MEESIPKCPKCNSEGFEFDQSNQGRILYRCKNSKCYYRYNSLTGTKLMHSGLSDDNIKLLYNLLYTDLLSISKIAEKLQVTRPLVYHYKKIWDEERKEGEDHVSLPRF